MCAHVQIISMYMQDALDELRAQGETVLQEHVERLFPLGLPHINLQGKHHFTLPEVVMQGHRRHFDSFPHLRNCLQRKT